MNAPNNKPPKDGGRRAAAGPLQEGHLSHNDGTIGDSVNSSLHDTSVITVVRDPRNLLGKIFKVSGGAVKKEAAVTVASGLAVQHHVPDLAVLQALLEEVAEDPRAAIINSGFKGIPIGEEFVLLSEALMARHVGKEDRANLAGVHAYKHEGRELRAVCRFKENSFHSAWQVLDRDVDEFTPPEHAEKGFADWLLDVEALLPGITSVDLLRVGSASSRVFHNGKPVGRGGGHVWLKVADAMDVPRVHAAIIPRAHLAGFTWSKPTFSRATGEKLPATRMCTIVDPATWVRGRLVFCGRPTAHGDGLEVRPPEFTLLETFSAAEYDSSQVTLDQGAIRQYRQQTAAEGREVVLGTGKDGLPRVDEYSLGLDLELEAKDRGIITVAAARDLLRGMEDGKLRCQAPFRASESWAGVARLGNNGDFCIHDVGTGTTYWLDGASRQADAMEDFQNLDLAEAQAAVDQAARRKAQLEDAAAIGDGETIVPKAEQITLDAALARFVLVVEGKLVVDLRNPRHALPFAEWKAQYAASKTVMPDGDGFRQARVADLWLTSPDRRHALSTTFRAGAGIFTQDPDGKPAVNTWKPYARPNLTAAQRGLVTLFLDHVAFLFPVEREREAFLDWIAHIEQCPGVLPHAHWLHIATQTGLGRNWLASVLARVWPGHTAANYALDLKGQFNGRLSRKILAIVDEVREEAGGTGIWREYETLKSMLTEEIRSINPKYGHTRVEWNSCRFLLFSNHGGALPLTDTDRRFNVVRTDAQPRAPEYYTRLYKALGDPAFVASVAVWLEERDISRFNAGARPLENSARAGMIGFHRSDIEGLAVDLVETWPCDLITTMALQSFLNDDRRPTDAAAFMKLARHPLERAGVVKMPKRVSMTGGVRHHLYAVRNGEQWVHADPDQIVQELLRGGRHLVDPELSAFEQRPGQ